MSFNVRHFAIIALVILAIMLLTKDYGIFTKEIEVNTTVQEAEQVVVTSPGQSGLIISGDEGVNVRYVNKTKTIRQNVSLLEYWLS